MEMYRSGRNEADSKSVDGSNRPGVQIPPSPPKKNPQKCGFFLCSCGFSVFSVFANLAVSCGLFAYMWHSNGTVKYPLQLRRGHLFTTPSLTLRVPRTKGAFALCLRLERPHHNISAFHSLWNAGRQRRHLGQHSKSSPGAGELLGESRITFCGQGRPCQERKQP